MERLFFIVNPTAANGRCAQGFALLEQTLRDKGVAYDAVYTTMAGGATRLAQDALERGERNIVAVGGDGTVNEVAAALVGKEATLGILPLGTGNDFARTLGVAEDTAVALAALLEGKRRCVDAGSVNGSVFLNAAGIGFDVEVVLATEKYKKRFKRLRGMAPFLMGVLHTLTHMRTLHMSVRVDGGEPLSKDALMVVVGNGAYFGGGMNVAPMADPFDGYFDVCIVDKISTMKFLQLFPKFVKGKHVTQPAVSWIHAKQIEISCLEPSPLELDGEPRLSTPASFALIPGAMQVFVP